jgi:hypothetical protein
MQANVCNDCGTALEGKQAWVRSGRLLCSDCDFAHKSPSRWAVGKPRKPHTPRPKGTYWKPQTFHTASMSWVDIQVVCATMPEALDAARAALPRGGGRIRAMRVEPTGARIPGEPHTVPGR